MFIELTTKCASRTGTAVPIPPDKRAVNRRVWSDQDQERYLIPNTAKLSCFNAQVRLDNLTRMVFAAVCFLVFIISLVTVEDAADWGITPVDDLNPFTRIDKRMFTDENSSRPRLTLKLIS